jgi:hypothetical protein
MWRIKNRLRRNTPNHLYQSSWVSGIFPLEMYYRPGTDSDNVDGRKLICDFIQMSWTRPPSLMGLVVVEVSIFGCDRLKNSSPDVRGVAAVWGADM